MRSPDAYGIMHDDDLFCLHKSTCIGLPQHSSEALQKTTLPGFYTAEKILLLDLYITQK